MSKPKRPGVRDISELKARLGLKKGGPASKRGVPAPGGIVAPPGAPAPNAVPAPPGAEPPRPAASQDPFGAMNAMAAQQAAHRAAAGPEIVVVNDGKPVEQVSGQQRAIRIAKIGALILTPLIVGVWVGQIASAASRHNAALGDVAELAKDVKQIRVNLTNLSSALTETKITAKTDNAALKKLTLEPPNIILAYQSNIFGLNRDLVQSVLSFYNRSTQLAKDLELHRKATKKDRAALVSAKAKHEKATTVDEDTGQRSYRYGVFIQIPGENDDPAKKPYGAKLVQLSKPICTDDKPAESGYCPQGIKGYLSRSSPEFSYKRRDMAVPNVKNTTVGASKLILFQPTSALNVLVKGSGESLAEMAYQQRLAAIAKALDELRKDSDNIEAALQSKARESKRFSFGL